MFKRQIYFLKTTKQTISKQKITDNQIKGQPSGEAFIQMDSEEAAYASAKEKHNKYMVLPGKNQKVRYIEVFQVWPTIYVLFFLVFNSFVNKLTTIPNGTIQNLHRICLCCSNRNIQKLIHFPLSVLFCSFPPFLFYFRVFLSLFLGFYS